MKTKTLLITAAIVAAILLILHHRKKKVAKTAAGATNSAASTIGRPGPNVLVQLTTTTEQPTDTEKRPRPNNVILAPVG